MWTASLQHINLNGEDHRQEDFLFPLALYKRIQETKTVQVVSVVGVVLFCGWGGQWRRDTLCVCRYKESFVVGWAWFKCHQLYSFVLHLEVLPTAKSDPTLQGTVLW